MRINWTPENCNKLREMYNTCDVADIAAYFKCSIASIYAKANKIGLKKGKKITGRPWSEEHEKIMFDLWPDKKEIAVQVGRSVNTVTEHARKNGLNMGFTPRRKWTQDEDKLLCELYPTIGRKQTSIRMGIPEEQVKSRAKTQNLRSANNDWSDADIALLKEKFPVCNRAELEHLFSRPAVNIYAKADSLDIRKDDDYISDESVKNWMRLSYRRRGMPLNISDNPNLVKIHKARILLTRKIKEYDRVG